MLCSRSPCGERGLKSFAAALVRRRPSSLPVRGAWIEIATGPRQAGRFAGRSPCGERGLKWAGCGGRFLCRSRSPCGERGLKFRLLRRMVRPLVSLPVRGAWIEMPTPRGHLPPRLRRSPCGERGLKLLLSWFLPPFSCRSPCGERGLKSPFSWPFSAFRGRSPCGERGLKLQQRSQTPELMPSLPVRGAWIEIASTILPFRPLMSLPVRGAWIEIRLSSVGELKIPLSLPVRGAWIEILSARGWKAAAKVAPRAGSVD